MSDFPDQILHMRNEAICFKWTPLDTGIPCYVGEAFTGNVRALA